MYLKLQGLVEVHQSDGRDLRFRSFNHIEINRSGNSINSSCSIRLPAKCWLSHGGQKMEQADTATTLGEGNRIEVSLGYGEELCCEFQGFIKEVKLGKLVELVCEGYEAQLRTNCEAKTFPERGSSTPATLRQVLEYLIDGTDIRLADGVPHVELGKYIVPGTIKKLEALQQLKERCLMTTFLDGDTLYCGLQTTPKLGTVKFRLGWNTLNQGSTLKWREKESQPKIKVKAVWVKPDNTQVAKEVGPKDGELRTFHTTGVTSEKELTRRAEEEMRKYYYEGYEGKIKSFLRPFAKPGMRCEVQDPDHADRNGAYFIVSTKVVVEMPDKDKAGKTGGGRRETELSYKI